MHSCTAYIRSSGHRERIAETSATAVARRVRGRSTLIVATACADVGNVRFDQRLGFRIRSVERGAFTATPGYADVIDIDGPR